MGNKIWFSANKTELHIYRLEAVESGKYTCKVENRAGITKLDIKVNVQRPPTIIGPKDVNVEVQMTQNITLNCPGKFGNLKFS